MCVAVLAAGFIWATFLKDAPYTTFAGTLGLVFAAYTGKRLLQKKEEFSERVD